MIWLSIRLGVVPGEVYACPLSRVYALLEVMAYRWRLRDACRLHDTIRCVIADLCSDLVPKITCQVWEPVLSPASGFEHPASTLPTRFPAALGIGHGSACGLANACALVYVAAQACSAIQVTAMS